MKILNILLTAGPTREPLDPVRFISNYSTGVLGYAIAQEARARNHRVILISGPTALSRPKRISLINVQTASQMQKQVKQHFSWCDVLIMAAAVGDFRAQKTAKRKIKRRARKELILRLTQNPDILAELGRRKGKKLLVGFALETERLRANAQDKLRQKNLDLIVATQIKTKSYPFGPTRVDGFIIDRQKRSQKITRTTKRKLARILLDSIEKIML